MGNELSKESEESLLSEAITREQPVKTADCKDLVCTVVNYEVWRSVLAL
jgi:hypothetical protein